MKLGHVNCCAKAHSSKGWATWSPMCRLTASGVFRVKTYREHVAQVAQAGLEVV